MKRTKKDSTFKKKQGSEKQNQKRKASSHHDKDHDNLIRVGFGDIAGVQGLLQTELPSYLKSVLNISTLKRLSDSYTDEKLKSTFSDRVFSCETVENETVLIAFLCEHKSYIPTEPIYIQLLQYKISHWRETALEGQKISCIIPIVIYHGEKDWDIKPFHTYFNLKTDVFNRFIPQFDIIFLNLRGMPEEKIIENPLLGKLRAVLIALKYAFNPNILLEYFELMLNFVVDSDGKITEVEIRFAAAVIEYIQRRTLMSEEQYLEKLENLTENSKDMATSTYHNIMRNMQKRAKAEAAIEVWEEAKIEGKIEGSQIFVTNLILSTDFNDEKIANLTNVTLEFVQNIRKKLRNSQ
jgi:predicted transposase YdaD